jgi:predicted DNA-binding protein with PD1-like motif
MHNMVLILALLTLTIGLRAQQTRTEVTNATTTVEDSKANSDTVSNAYAITGQFERVLVLRFKFEADLLAGLEAMVKQERIRNAVILSGIGSVRNYRYHVVSNRTFPSKDMFVTVPTGPADIAGMNGYVIDGRVHAHITFADSVKSFGGHLERGTNVFTFAIVTIGVLNDNMDLKRVDDKTYR